MTLSNYAGKAATALAMTVPGVAAAGVVVVDDRPLMIGGPTVGHTLTQWDIDGDSGFDVDFWNFRRYQSGENSKSRYSYIWFQGASAQPRYGVFAGTAFDRFGDAHVAGLDSSESIPNGPFYWNWGQIARLLTFSYRTSGGGNIVFDGVGCESDYYGNLICSPFNYDLHEGLNKIGFVFDNASGTHFGWAEIRLSSVPYVTLAIERWAYESEPDTAIHVEPIPTPPAGIAALTLLGMGAVGLRQLRGRR